MKLHPKSFGLSAGRTAKPVSFGNRWSSHAIIAKRRLRLSSPIGFRALAKRARSLARLSVRHAAHQSTSQPGHDAPGRASPAPETEEKSRAGAFHRRGYDHQRDQLLSRQPAVRAAAHRIAAEAD